MDKNLKTIRSFHEKTSSLRYKGESVAASPPQVNDSATSPVNDAAFLGISALHSMPQLTSGARTLSLEKFASVHSTLKDGTIIDNEGPAAEAQISKIKKDDSTVDMLQMLGFTMPADKSSKNGGMKL